MTLTVERTELGAALRLAERAATQRANLPILGGVLLDARTPGTLTLAATDLELAIRSSLPVDGPGGWACVVTAGLFARLVGRLAGESVELRLIDNRLHLTSGGAQFDFTTLPADDFPAFPEIQPRATVQTTAGLIACALDRVAIATEPDDQRPFLTGVLAEARADSLTLVATDTSRLALDTLRIEAPTGVDGDAVVSGILSRVSMISNFLHSLGPGAQVDLEIGNTIAVLRAGDSTLAVRLIEGQFPRYQAVLLGDPGTRVAFERKPLLDAIDRLSLLRAKKDAVVVVFTPGSEPGTVALRAVQESVGQGTETVRTVNSAWPERLVVAYQARYLTDVLSVLAGETVEYRVSDPERQCEWTVPGVEYRYIVMPILRDAFMDRRPADDEPDDMPEAA